MSEQTQVTGEKESYNAGEIIFKEGDPGGDLFLIKSGQIEVYREQEKAKIRLAILQKGEILGVMTCLTRDPRLASARAISDVEVLVVKQAGFNSLIASTPKWVKTVIKDFILRIKNLNQMYGNVMTELRVSSRRTSILAVAANLMAYLQEYALGVDDDAAQLSPWLDKASRIYDVDRTVLRDVVDALGKAGIIELEGGPEGAVRTGKLDNCVPFAAYTRSYLQQPENDMTENISKEELLLYLKIVDVARYANLNFQSEVRLKVGKVKAEVDKLKHGLFHRNKLEKAKQYKWLSIDKSGEESILFTPQELEIKAKSVHAWMLLEALRDGKSKAPAVAEAAQVITEEY